MNNIHGPFDGGHIVGFESNPGKHQRAGKQLLVDLDFIIQSVDSPRSAQLSEFGHKIIYIVHRATTTIFTLFDLTHKFRSAF